MLNARLFSRHLNVEGEVEKMPERNGTFSMSCDESLVIKITNITDCNYYPDTKQWKFSTVNEDYILTLPWKFEL